MFQWVIISLLLCMVVLGVWLHNGERSLAFAKPLIVSALNMPNAPYVVTIGTVTVDWSELSLLGKLHIRDVTFAKREGITFAKLPDLYATIDPLGFLPSRRLLHKVILRAPKMAMTRNEQGVIEFGIEGASERMQLPELLAFFGSADTATDSAVATKSDWLRVPNLPFHNFIIEQGSLKFTDANSGTLIRSTPFDFQLVRHHGAYSAVVSLPFEVDGVPVGLNGTLRSVDGTRDYKMSLTLSQFPLKLLCLFGTCPANVDAKGMVDGAVNAVIADDFSVHAFDLKLATEKAEVTTPQWFAETLKLNKSEFALQGDWSAHQVTLSSLLLSLEDTTIRGSGEAHRDEKGWYASGEGATTKLDITKLYKYWPLVLAPDSRTWVTSKLKSGYAEKGTIKFNFAPEDFAASIFPEKTIDAIVDARDITFEYLPGFPLVEKMNGLAHFTATTVKVEGSGGSLMSGTKINHAVLWCPELISDHNPMEATIDLAAPATDVVTMLALKYFPFDDAFGLDAKNIQGTVDALLKLKFNAFSNKPNSDPNEIHLEAVDYDIAATIKNAMQDKLFGTYKVRDLNGTLKANNAGIDFAGSLMVGASATNDVKLTQTYGKPMTIAVNGREVKGNRLVNDFTLTYGSTAGKPPQISLRGKRLDASISYGKSENGLLKNFPALALDVKLGELVFSMQAPLREVVGILNCSHARCESADFSAKIGNNSLRGSIHRVAGGRQLLFESSDAGSVLKAFDISDRVTKGNLNLQGTYDDSQTPPQLDARLMMTNFTLKNSQILGRILSVGSLTGIRNALTGGGISFDKLAANIASQGGVITVDKGIANGTALGITVEGAVDTNTTKLDLKGVVVPAYALNSILGKIPIIGALIGGEGEGLIAFNYWIGGAYDKPDVGVNPLSGLTPGFLRGIFGAFEGNDKSDGNATKSVDQNPVGEVLRKRR